MANDFYTGPIGADLAGADLSYFVSGIVAAVVYLAARRRFAPRVAPSRRGRPRQGRPAAEDGLSQGTS